MEAVSRCGLVMGVLNHKVMHDDDCDHCDFHPGDETTSVCTVKEHMQAFHDDGHPPSGKVLTKFLKCLKAHFGGSLEDRTS